MSKRRILLRAGTAILGTLILVAMLLGISAVVTLIEDNKSMKVHINEQKQFNDSLIEENAGLSTELWDLKTNLMKINAENVEAKEHIEVLKIKNNDLKKSLESITKDNNILSDEIEKLKKNNAELKDLVSAKEKERSQASPLVSRGSSGTPTKEMYMSATAYTAYCNGCSGTTATGIDLRSNPELKVIAVDPTVIPLGTKVHVEGYGYAIAGDTGGAIKGSKIDIFVPNKDDALLWGRKTVKVTVLGSN